MAAQCRLPEGILAGAGKGEHLMTGPSDQLIGEVPGKYGIHVPAGKLREQVGGYRGGIRKRTIVVPDELFEQGGEIPVEIDEEGMVFEVQVVG